MTYKAIIYKPAKTAMQSGKKNTKEWVVEIENPGSRYIDNLMGWTGSKDTSQQIKLKFPSMEDAIRYVKNNYSDFEIKIPNSPVIIPKNYADNFLD